MDLSQTAMINHVVFLLCLDYCTRFVGLGIDFRRSVPGNAVALINISADARMEGSVRANKGKNYIVYSLYFLYLELSQISSPSVQN